MEQQNIRTEYHPLKDDGNIPNNERLPLIVYSGVHGPGGGNGAEDFEELFSSNSWNAAWRNGVYPYHHYHSTAHEVLGVYSGSATIQLGGDRGVKKEVKAGDVILIPAGVAHKRLSASPDFGVVGAYPPGQQWDMNYGKDGERPQTDENIRKVPVPPEDPVFGKQGPVQELWGKR